MHKQLLPANLLRSRTLLLPITKKTKTFIKNLNLTGDQKNKQNKLPGRCKKQQKESIQNDKSLSDSQKQGKLKELKKQTREKQQSVLTKEQQAQWKTAKKNARKQKS